MSRRPIAFGQTDGSFVVSNSGAGDNAYRAQQAQVVPAKIVGGNFDGDGRADLAIAGPAWSIEPRRAQNFIIAFLDVWGARPNMPHMNPIRRKTAKSERTSAPMVKVNNASRTPRASQAEIAARSYELYVARGGEHGHDEEDWLQAESELGGR